MRANKQFFCGQYRILLPAARKVLIRWSTGNNHVPCDNDEIPNEEEIKSSENLKKEKDVLGRIRGVQLRSGSVSDKDGNKKLVIDSIDKVRKWIDFMINADSSREKPIQVTKSRSSNSTSDNKGVTRKSTRV